MPGQFEEGCLELVTEDIWQRRGKGVPGSWTSMCKVWCVLQSRCSLAQGP
jgi:hypothetical protein